MIGEAYSAAQPSGVYVTAINRHLKWDEISYILTDCGQSIAGLGLYEFGDPVEGTPEYPIRWWRVGFGVGVFGWVQPDGLIVGGSWSRLPMGPGSQGRNRSRASPPSGFPPAWAQAVR